MTRKLTAMVSAAALASTAFAPAAQAHDWHGYHGGYGHYGHYYGYGHRGNEAAVGVLGLVLGLAAGAAISQPRADRCYNGCGAPQPYRQGYDDGYRDGPSLAGGPGYDDGSAYDQDYGQAPYKSQCTRRERQFDRYANRYVTVDVPC
jgi:opacity protein-like surface antigen